MEDPEALACFRVVPADESLFVDAALRRAPWKMRGADDDHVLRDHRRRVQPHLAFLEIDRLIVFFFQIDDAVPAEAGCEETRFRIERDHLIPGRDVDNARALAAAARPVRQAASRQLARRRLAALALVLAVHPEHLAGRCVERDGGAPCAGGGVDDAVHHQRRPLVVELGPRAERVGLEAPRDLELVEVLRGDLIERRVARARKVAAIGGPFGPLRLRRLLAAQIGGGEQKRGGEEPERAVANRVVANHR